MKALLKVAATTSPDKRMKDRAYRAANKEKVKRSARRRKRMQAAGLKLKTTRIGTGAGGYTFVVQGKKPQSSGSKGGPSASAAAKKIDFNPHQQPMSTSHVVKMRM
jgi:hypothetical protein